MIHRTFRASDRSSPSSWKWAIRLVSLAVFSVGWELLAGRMDSLLFPSFTETFSALARLLIARALWEAVWVSNQAMVLGFTLAVIVGIFLGLLMGRWRTAEMALDPYLNILLVTPMSALIPIIIMATGLGIVSRVLIVFTFSVIAIIVNTRAGLKTIDRGWIEMAQSFGATEIQLWRKIFMRGAAPAIAIGLRLGVARAVTGMITVELLLIALGLGRLILEYQGSFQAENLYATVLVVTFEAVLLIQLFKHLERRAAPWVQPAAVE